jgi:3-phenylpropionate/trans-cinnamate dioxygenase ferredoxin subunit
MAEYIEVSGREELKSGQMKLVSVAGNEVILARVGDDFYAADNRCPHMGGNLSRGTLEKTIVTCPLHHSQFDLTDGHVVRWTDWSGLKLALAKLFKPPRPLKTYRVKLEGDRVFVETGKAPGAVG